MKRRIRWICEKILAGAGICAFFLGSGEPGEGCSFTGFLAVELVCAAVMLTSALYFRQKWRREGRL